MFLSVSVNNWLTCGHNDNDCCFAALHSGNQFVLDLQTVYDLAYGYYYGYSHARYEDGYSLFEIPGGVFKYTQTADGDETVIIPRPLQEPLIVLVSSSVMMNCV